MSTEETQNDVYYNLLKSQNIKNYAETNDDAIQKIIDSINQNYASLNYISNQMNTLGNLDQEMLIKKDQLIRMENDDLMNQLRELEKIQSVISNKDRLIEQTHYNIEKQNKNIRVLVISIILAIFLFITLFLLQSGKLIKKKAISIIIFILIIYFILFIYSYNIFYFQDSMKMLFDRKALHLGTKLNQWSEKINNEINEGKQNWIDQNCACPPKAEEISIPVYQESENEYEEQSSGYFYYDGTAPPQLLVPTPNKKLNENIEWVDYSHDGSSKYDSNLNKVFYNNNNFYNYHGDRDPEIIKMKELDKSHLYVDDKTKTKNM